MAVDPRNIDADALAGAIARRLASPRWASPRSASPLAVSADVLASAVAWRLAAPPRTWASQAAASPTATSPAASSVAAAEIDPGDLAREVARRMSEDRADRDPAQEAFDALASKLAGLLGGPKVHGTPWELDGFADQVAYALWEELGGDEGGGLTRDSTDAGEVVEETEKAAAGEEDESR